MRGEKNSERRENKCVQWRKEGVWEDKKKGKEEREERSNRHHINQHPPRG